MRPASKPRSDKCPLTLTHAARDGDLATLRVALADSADPVRDGTAALVVAAEAGRLGAAAELLSHGAQLHGHDDDALTAAASRGHVAMLLLLLRNLPLKDSVNARGGSALCAAVSRGYLASVLTLLKFGADPEVANHEPLRIASMRGDLQMVRVLCQGGANLSARDDMALSLAASHGHTALISYLISKGADVHGGRQAALASAIHDQQAGAARVLLAAGARPDQLPQGFTPRLVAMMGVRDVEALLSSYPQSMWPVVVGAGEMTNRPDLYAALVSHADLMATRIATAAAGHSL